MGNRTVKGSVTIFGPTLTTVLVSKNKNVRYNVLFHITLQNTCCYWGV